MFEWSDSVRKLCEKKYLSNDAGSDLSKSSQVYFTIRTFQEYASRKQRKDHAVIKADCTL